VGEVMAIGRTFKQALLKAVRSLETGRRATAEDIEPRILTKRLVTPHPERLREIKRMGFSDARLGESLQMKNGRAASEKIYQLRKQHNVRPVFKRVDTCAAEFESYTPYLYSTYEEEDEAAPTDRKKVIILGSGPNRIGQGI